MERARDSARPKRRVHGVIAVLALAASVVFVAPVSAQDEPLPPGVEVVRTKGDGTVVYRAPQAFAYDNTTGGDLQYVVVQGGDMFDVCGIRDPEGLPPLAKVLVRERGKRHVIKTAPAGVTSYTSVYRTNLPVIPDFFDATCGGFFENGTPIPAPFATGLTTLRRWESVVDVRDALDIRTPQGRGKYRNGVTGVVADADGNTYDLEAVADFSVSASGAIPNFRTLTVSLTPTG